MQHVGAFLAAPRLLSPCGPWAPENEGSVVVEDGLNSLPPVGSQFPMRESVPRQFDKKSRGPQGERGLEFSRRKKGQTFLLLFVYIP